MPESGTLNEYTVYNISSTNAYIADGEIDIVKNTAHPTINDTYNSVTFNHGYNVNIEIEVGNIRRCFGKWNDNIQWMIREVID
jgi:hypothetical protein